MILDEVHGRAAVALRISDEVEQFSDLLDGKLKVAASSDEQKAPQAGACTSDQGAQMLLPQLSFRSAISHQNLHKKTE